ncbi:DUF3341 domain-containing protein [Salibacter sp.]|uniref:DUF3341 domain-containing protein n=1 Tax=Salibacter sp. TaxID=2010995 RepID=UPI0028700357|nr:DUF3341 domain-containing protein [Salibacter sp.]MDR9398024.1 DUF3341 domain-containing protein [Salibacter sp.]MDR9486890.1 DUF3341 domain-containing protein [Salibacter sp.]
MTKEKYLYGLYNDDELLVDGIKHVQSKGIKVNDAYSPFPVHGLEDVLGIKWTRLAIAAFLFGLTGLALSMLAINYFMIIDWPMNIGGKPSFNFYENLPAFVPIIFEFTVLCAAHGMAITYFFRNMTFPGMPARNPHPRTTDDHFAVEISPEGNEMSVEDLKSALKETEVVEIFEKERITKFV